MNLSPVPRNEMSRKPRIADEMMRFGVFWPYSKTLLPSTLLNERNPDVLDLQNHIALAEASERVGMDFILLADGYAPGSEAGSSVGFQDPRTHAVIWAVPIMLATRHLGVISTIHTTYVHPVHMARFAGHLDWLSGGRWGWNVVNGFRDHEAKLFGFEGLPDHDGSFDMADEYVEVIKKLWSDQPVEHEGRFKVSGKLAGPRPAGQPLFVSAASSPRGRTFAAEHCDYLFSSMPQGEGWNDLLSLLRDKAQAAKRPRPPGVLVLADFLLRRKPGAAQDEYNAIIASLDGQAQTAWSSQTARLVKQKTTGPLQLVGTPEEVADQIRRLHHEKGLRGLLLRMPFWHESELDEVPEMFQLLNEAGIWVPPAARYHSW